jgi:predicted small lipoprotein YifL
MLKFLGICTGLLLAIFSLAGCGKGDPRQKPPDVKSLTPAEFFNQTQEGTVTPHGPIIPGSAKDVGEGAVQYQTEDGSIFQVETRRTAEGYRYLSPRKVEPEPPQTSNE